MVDVDDRFFKRELEAIPMNNLQFKTYQVGSEGAPASLTRGAVGAMTLPTDSTARKNIPIVTGLLDYFPAALAEVAKLSKLGNEKHNPGQPLHHARGKSTDHADCIGRHMIDRNTIDPDTGLDHMVEVCWRSLALLQEIMESRGAPLARGAKLPEDKSAKVDDLKLQADCEKIWQAALTKFEKDMIYGTRISSIDLGPAPSRRGKGRGQVKADHHNRRRKARK